MEILIRPEQPADRQAIFDLNASAFETVDEARLVDKLRAGGFAVVSLAATRQADVVGHILFSRLEITTATETLSGLALAPLAVRPDCQRQGIGSRLIVASLHQAREQGERFVVVLGHPEYYPRFGFSSALAVPLRSPFSGPAWMALELAPGALSGVAGRVRYAAPFGIE